MDIFSLMWMIPGALLGVLVMALFAIAKEEDEDNDAR